MKTTFDRRAATALIGAGFLCPGDALGQSVDFPSAASRLTPLMEQPYNPPASLTAVAHIFYRLTAPVKINDSGPYPFIVDTGANQSVISEELARRLNLLTGPPAPLNGVAGIEMAATATVKMEIGGAVRTAVTVSLLPAAGIGAAGMLGLDGLEDKRFTLDFRAETLRIESGGRFHRNPVDIAIKARRRDGQLTLVDADLDGVPVTAFIDSGAQNTIGNLALEALALRREAPSRWAQIPILSATGQTITARIADLPNLRIARLKLPSWPVAFADLHTFRMWDLTDRPAILLGIDVLSRFESVCLDFPRSEVRFRLPQQDS